MEQQRASLVAVEQLHLAFGVAHRDTHAVSVWVSGQNQVGIDLIGFFQCQLQCGFLFRVGRFHRREVAIGHGLFIHQNHILEAVHLQCLGHHRNTGSVQRRIDNLQFLGFLDGFGMQRQRFHQIEIGFIDLLAHHLNQFRVGLPLHLLHRRDFVHLLDDIDIVRRHQLATILPIHLVAIVLHGIVRCGNHNTCMTLQMAHGKREHRRGAQFIEKKDFDIICGKNLGRNSGKFGAMQTRIERNHHLDGLFLEAFQQIIGESLRCSTHRIFVHPVGSNAHDAAQTASSEFQIAVKSVRQCFGVLLLQTEHLISCFYIIIIGKPKVDFVLNRFVHNKNFIHYKSKVPLLLHFLER